MVQTASYYREQLKRLKPKVAKAKAELNEALEIYSQITLDGFELGEVSAKIARSKLIGLRRRYNALVMNRRNMKRNLKLSLSRIDASG